MWEKPTAPPLWGNASVNGRRKPCAKPMQKARKTPGRRSRRVERRFRKTLKRPKSNGQRHFARRKRLDNTIDNGKGSILRRWERRYRSWARQLGGVSRSAERTPSPGK